VRGRREKTFGPGRTVPLDRNAKARIQVYARAWDRQHRQPGQRGGALGRAALDVLSALMWAFHNARSGHCFPSYETIAAKAGCARSTVAEAIKALEFDGRRWRVVRTSNAHVLIDPASLSPTNGLEHQTKRFLCLQRHQRSIPPARSSEPWPGSVQRSARRMALRRAAAPFRPHSQGYQGCHPYAPLRRAPRAIC